MTNYYQTNHKLKINKSHKLAYLTTFKIGGLAKYFVEPKSKEQLKEAFLFAEKNNIKKYIIGGGANLLISDKGLDGLVISTRKLMKCRIKNDLITAECGISIKNLNKKILKHSLTGLEFTGGLPGSLGGAVYMNARAYGSQLSDVVETVLVIKEDGTEINLSNNELKFSYKNSIFMHNHDLFIYSVNLKLKKDNKKQIKKNYKKNINDRKFKGQYLYPSAGCTFKNDYNLNIVVGKLIDSLGLKGMKIGDAMVYQNHANFIVNINKAKADDVKKLIELVEKKVYEEKGIKLHREVRLLGFD
jgi:UDP-N-acetylmuramate dehydrogenase